MSVSTRGLIGLVAFAALGCAGLLFPSPAWVGIAFVCAIASLASSYLGILLLRGWPQAFSVGFALFGTLYLLACFVPQTGPIIAAALRVITRNSNSNIIHFSQVLSAMVVAFIGGLNARYFYWLRHKEDTGTAGHAR